MHTAGIADIPVKLPESLVPLHTNYMTLCIMYKAKMLGMHLMIPEHAQEQLQEHLQQNSRFQEIPDSLVMCWRHVQGFCMCNAVAFMKVILNFSFIGKRRHKS